MDKASDFGSEDCEFESRRGRMCFDDTNMNSCNSIADTILYLDLYVQ